MTIVFSNRSNGQLAVPFGAQAGEAMSYRATYALPNTGNGTALNDIIDMAPVPPGCRVTDIILDTDQLDSNVSPTLTLDVGYMTGAPGDTVDSAGSARTCGTDFFSAATTGQAGGVARPTLVGAYRTDSVADTYRSIGIKIHAAAATKAAGEIGLTVFYANSTPGDST